MTPYGYEKNLFCFTCGVIPCLRPVALQRAGVKTGIQACPCANREPVFKDHGFPASSAGQALLEFIPHADAGQERQAYLGAFSFDFSNC